jgi:hypothetical protein
MKVAPFNPKANMRDPKDYVYIERYKDIGGGEIVELDPFVVDIHRDQLAQTLKLHPLFKLVPEKPKGNDVPAPEKPVEDKNTGYACPLCPKIFKTATTLKAHQRKAHK